MRIEQSLTKEEKKLIGDTIEGMLSHGEVRPLVLIGLAEYALDFLAYDLQKHI